MPRLLAPIEEGGVSRREWLGAVPSSRTCRGLSEQMEKVEFLKELGAERLILPDLPLAGLEYFARRMGFARRQPPSWIACRAEKADLFVISMGL